MRMSQYPGCLFKSQTQGGARIARAFRSLLCGLMVCVGSFAVSAETAYLDKIVFGEGADAVRKVAGEVTAETLHTEMGSFLADYPVHTLGGKGAELTFPVRAPADGASLILEVQEIHDR